MVESKTQLLGDLAGDMDKFNQQIQEQVVFAGVAAMAKVMYDQAVSNAERNKKTGLLQGSIYRAFSPEKSNAELKTYRISWNKKKAPHGHLIEFGTSRAPAYPFIRPAFDHVREAIEAGKDRMAQKFDELKGAI